MRPLSWWARSSALAAIGAALGGCPLPFQYAVTGWAGNASTVDPSTPGITDIPSVDYSQASGSGGALHSGQSATTSSDTSITLVSGTATALIYYTTNGTTPDPGSPQTLRFDPGSPIELAIASPTPNDASASITLNAVAIGPNMKPSPVMTNVDLTVHYPQASAPVFSPPGGAYTADQSISMSSTTPGAVIYYTMVAGPGPAPAPVPGQAGTVKYTGPITLSGPSNTYAISAIATVSQMMASTTTSASYTISYPGLPAPALNPPAGTYSNDQTVTVTSGAGSTIWYTTDGSAPVVGSSASLPSGGTITLSGTAGTGAVTVRAVASEATFADSPQVTANYLFQASAPSASPGAGTYSNDLTGASAVSLSTATTGATIYYTTDGSTPTTSSTVYTGPISITSTTTVNAIAVRANYLSSVVTSALYTMQAAAPTFSLAGGTYSSGPLSVTISEATAGATVYYTTNGTTPTTSSSVYTGAITIPNGVSTTLSAIAVKSGYVPSIVDSVTYLVLATPQGLTIGNATSSSISISWTAVPGTALTQYVVVRGTEPTCTISPYYLYPSGTSFTDSGLSASTQYYYKIRADYTGGSSAYSGVKTGGTISLLGSPPVVTVTLPGPYPTPPGQTASFFTSSGTPTPNGPSLLYGGYTYIPYSWDTNNDVQVQMVVFDSNYNQVASYIITGTRYVYAMSIVGTLVTITGQQGPVTWALVPPP